MAIERRTRAYLLCQLLGWAAYGALVMALYSASDIPRLRFALHSIVYCSAGGLLTHALRGRIRRDGWTRLRPLPLAMRIAVSSVALASALAAVTAFSSFALFHLSSHREVSWAGYAFLVLNFSFVFTIWQLIYFGLHALERANRAELEQWQLTAAAQDSELRFLRAQMHPHFLFNCLNGLRALIAEDPARAQQMVTQLGSILRHSLASETSPTVPLQRELEVVSDYLALEAVRLEERLRVKLEVSPESLTAPIPPMLLQTLVENAIKHGVSRLPHGGEVSVSASVQGGALALRVRSPLAPEQPLPTAGSLGLGLNNARERLRLLFGERASLSLEAVGDFAAAHVRIPLAS